MTRPSDWHKTKFYFLGNPVKLEPDWQKLRVRGRKELTLLAQLKLEWIIFYYTLGKKNAKVTAIQFGITRKTIHKWLKRYRETGLSGLEDRSTAPVHVRRRQISLDQRLKVRHLRKMYPKLGFSPLCHDFFISANNSSAGLRVKLILSTGRPLLEIKTLQAGIKTGVKIAGLYRVMAEFIRRELFNGAEGG